MTVTHFLIWNKIYVNHTENNVSFSYNRTINHSIKCLSTAENSKEVAAG